MKKFRKLTAIVLGGLAICLTLNISEASERSDDPRPEGNSKIIYLC